MAHLPNLNRLPLQPTGVIGDETADVDWEERANLRRFKYEYAEALDDPDEALQTTLLTWAVYCLLYTSPSPRDRG